MHGWLVLCHRYRHLCHHSHAFITEALNPLPFTVTLSFQYLNLTTSISNYYLCAVYQKSGNGYECQSMRICRALVDIPRRIKHRRHGHHGSSSSCSSLKVHFWWQDELIWLDMNIRWMVKSLNLSLSQTRRRSSKLVHSARLIFWPRCVSNKESFSRTSRILSSRVGL